jgi:hypothetical protein
VFLTTFFVQIQRKMKFSHNFVVRFARQNVTQSLINYISNLVVKKKRLSNLFDARFDHVLQAYLLEFGAFPVRGPLATRPRRQGNDS